MANPYPANVEAQDGTTRIEGFVDFTDPDNQPGGSSGWTVVKIDDADSPYDAAVGDLIVASDAATGITINLPADPAVGSQIAVYCPVNPAGTVSVVAAGETEINQPTGAANTLYLGYQFDQVVLVWDGTAWDALVPPIDQATLTTVLAEAGLTLSVLDVSGNVTLTGLPGADPHVAGRLYTTAGAVLISAG